MDCLTARQFLLAENQHQTLSMVRIFHKAATLRTKLPSVLFFLASGSGRVAEQNGKILSRLPTNQPLGATGFDNFPGSGSRNIPSSGLAGTGTYPSESGLDSTLPGFKTIPNSVNNAVPDSSSQGFKNIPGVTDTSLSGFKSIPDNRGIVTDGPTHSEQPQSSTNGQIGSQIPSLSQTLPGQKIIPFNQQQTDLTSPSTNSNQPSPSQTSDIMTQLRNAFKLPPGFCLVRCDSLKPGQISLTPQQVKDAFASAGLFGK